MIKKYTFNLLYIVLIFFLFEFGVRFFFPEFTENNIFYDKNKYHRISKGKETFFQYIGNTKFRVKDLKQKIIFNDKNSLWFLGDSITNGYGVDFNDTYYSKFKKKIKGDINIYASSEYNSDYKNTFSNLNETIIKHLKKNDIVIYQFNFNDIIEIAKQNPEFKNEDMPNRGIINLINYTNKFRYKYLNYSSFFKLLQHHASIAARNTKGTCKDRKIHALGPYTYGYFGKYYESKSQKLWDIFLNEIIITNKKLKTLDVSFFILIPPISLEVKNHEKTNKLKYDLNCSTKNGHKHIIKILTENNINFIDALPEFNNYMNKTINKSEYLFHSYDTNHPNEKGHELIAQAMLKKLKQFSFIY